jgi:hypothetical protein
MFSYLDDDLKANILSFVADGPLEGRNGPIGSTLTHTMPLVSRKIRDIANCNELWKMALARQVSSEPALWRTGLQNILHEEDPQLQCSSSNDMELVENARALHGTSYKQLYARVLSEQVRFKGPVFFMPGHVQFGEAAYGLHFFEPRYRLMIAEVMQSHSHEARNGGQVRGTALFIHANRAPLAPSSPAVLVQVRSCQIYPDGRADVFLAPVSHVCIEKLWVRPNSGHLFYAQCRRMPLGLTHKMNILARGEMMAQVMGSLASHISQAAEDDDAQDQNEYDDSSVDSSSTHGSSSSMEA